MVEDISVEDLIEMLEEYPKDALVRIRVMDENLENMFLTIQKVEFDQDRSGNRFVCICEEVEEE